MSTIYIYVCISKFTNQSTFIYLLIIYLNFLKRTKKTVTTINHKERIIKKKILNKYQQTIHIIHIHYTHTLALTHLKQITKKCGWEIFGGYERTKNILF